MSLQQFDILQWSIFVDPEVTAQAYHHLELGCTCAYCRNFIAAQTHIPEPVYHTLQLLGIDPLKPAEIVEYTENPDGSHFYGWWYHTVGQMIAEREHKQDSSKPAMLTPNCEMLITEKIDLVADDFPQPVLQIEFFCNLPWVLEESAR